MSVELVCRASEQRVFGPSTRFADLVDNYVRFDELTGRGVYETKVLRAITNDPVCAAVVGPVGAGKSSLIADVCAHLPETHVALRVPIVGIDDPTKVSTVAAMALSTALNAIALEAYQREALEQARADQVTKRLQPPRVGGKLGGGAIPVEVHAEVESLQTELASNRLAGERLAGIDRLVSILAARDRLPVFVFEDTEAAVGGRDQLEVIDGFFDGPVTAFMREIDAGCLIAVQDRIAEQPAFQYLAPSMVVVELPHLATEAAHAGLKRIIGRRLQYHEIAGEPEDVIADDALTLLVEFYDATDGSLRHTLAALQTAVEHAAEVGSDLIVPGHVRVAVNDWGTVC